jgi:hypothetical protein
MSVVLPTHEVVDLEAGFLQAICYRSLLHLYRGQADWWYVRKSSSHARSHRLVHMLYGYPTMTVVKDRRETVLVPGLRFATIALLALV